MSRGTTYNLSGQLRERLRFETLLADISSRFVNVPAERVDEEIENAQRAICAYLGVEHSTLWQIVPDDPVIFLLTHWVRDAALRPAPTRMVSRESFPWVHSKLVKKEMICFADTAKAPPEAARDSATWREFGIKSTLGIPLSAGGGPVFGVLSFEATSKPRDWPQALQKRLLVLADVFANALARKQADMKLRESEARLSLAAQSANAGLWTLNAETGEIWATELTFRLLGIPCDDRFNVKRLTGLLEPPDQQRMQQAINDAIRTGEETAVEYRIVRPDGNVRWLASRGRRHSHTVRDPVVLMGVTVDVTAAKQLEADRAALTMQLLRAQEAESARIARELHDDLGQSLALLSVQLHTVIQQAQQGSQNIRGSLEELRAKVCDIAHRVSTISHQLHASELELLGLAGAAKRLCRETSEANGIMIQFSGSRLPGTRDTEVELCLFRVLQEALTNAVRHSHAGQVQVRLRRRGGHIQLRVQDDGTGFEQEKLPARSGLGLVSMAERLRLVGGNFSVRSSTGKGTTIEADAVVRETKPNRRRAKSDTRK